ncbi:hypothetical protein GCM10008171_33230 [Methylopila jiangsuensis]|uniref:Uncharacterized protein n=1 Tax=Methylopila jiangsuensis TaxID=586230 RepID=A0A9W6N4E7_9HYPH|nr:hypothetical protein [Methylopila jiangsuensis]MDR6284542.1 hypothetical protein [Methylopila jiangsuensis]GLK78069.1 hypothetical protein GCM10008171_33230 [Methylopila jiangsuensis]
MIALATVAAARKADIIADMNHMASRPAGCPCNVWRESGPVRQTNFAVRDGRYKTRPRRQIMADTTADMSVMVLSLGAQGRIIDRIDLTAPDAQERLDRYAEA